MLKARDFALGAIERHGRATIRKEHGAYIVIAIHNRDSIAGDYRRFVEGFPTLTEARSFARKVR